MSLDVQKMSDTNKPKQPKFTLEFKQDAARLVIEKGYTHQQAADCGGSGRSAAGKADGHGERTRCHRNRNPKGCLRTAGIPDESACFSTAWTSCPTL